MTGNIVAVVWMLAIASAGHAGMPVPPSEGAATMTSAPTVSRPSPDPITETPLVGAAAVLAAQLAEDKSVGAQPAAAVFAGLGRTSSSTGELTRDEILDNITLYWLTNTGVSSSRLYWEYKGGFCNAKGVKSPVAVTVFPSEQYEAPRSWTERAYPKLIHYNRVAKGGHFAAWEQPTIFVEELRTAFKTVR